MSNIDTTIRKTIKSIGTALVARDRAEQSAKARFDEALRGAFERIRSAFEAEGIPKDQTGHSQMRRILRDAEKSDAGAVLASGLKSGTFPDLSTNTWNNYKTGLYKSYVLGVEWYPKAFIELTFPWAYVPPENKANVSTKGSVKTEETKPGEVITTSPAPAASPAASPTLTKESVAVALATDLDRLALLGEREAKLAETLRGLLKTAEILK